MQVGWVRYVSFGMLKLGELGEVRFIFRFFNRNICLFMISNVARFAHLKVI